MSESVAVGAAGIAAPLLFLVLLVAGVTWVAVRAAGLASNQAKMPDVISGTDLGLAVRQCASAMSATDGSLLMATEHSLGTHSFVPRGLEDRLRQRAAVELAAETRALSEIGMAQGEQRPGLLAAAGHLARAKALASTIDAEVALSLVAAQHHAADLSTASLSLLNATSAYHRGDAATAARLATDAELSFSRVAHASFTRLAAAGRATAVAQAANALQDRGFSVRVAHKRGAVALLGQRKAQTVAVVSKPGGHFAIDLAGFDGHACQSEMDRLLEGMKRQGLVLTDATRRRHGSIGGGPLISLARKQHAPLEQALAELALPANTPIRRSTTLMPTDENHAALAWLFDTRLDQQAGGGR